MHMRTRSRQHRQHAGLKLRWKKFVELLKLPQTKMSSLTPASLLLFISGGTAAQENCSAEGLLLIMFSILAGQLLPQC